MNALTVIDIPRLAKLCGMFSSEHLGERAAAAAKADALVRGAGLRWGDVLGANLTGAGYSETSRRRDILTPATILAMYGQALTGWEKRFLAGLVTRGNALSQKQRDVLAGIRARFE